MKFYIIIVLLCLTGALSAQVEEGAFEYEDQPTESPFDHYEHIRTYHSDIQIDTLGNIFVTENIQFRVMGEQIKRGFIRSLPITRRDKYGRNIDVNIEVLGVKKNNTEEYYQLGILGKYLEITIGNPDVLLPEGIYDYSICYKISDQIGFFDSFDELYWNVTGSEWEFLINRASATIYLPKGAKILENYCYTGELGSTESFCSYTIDEVSNSVTFVSDIFLEKYKGLTVVVGFTAGIITRPPPPSTLEVWWITYGKIFSVSILFCLVIAYYTVTWRKHGKNEKKEIIIPTFEVPDGLSPAMIRYIYTQKKDSKGFMITIVNLAIKGYLSIEKRINKYYLNKLNFEQKGKISKEEEATLKKLFGKTTEIKLAQSSSKELINAETSLNSALAKETDLTKYIIRNSEYKFKGLFLCISACMFMVALFFGTFNVIIFTLITITLAGVLLHFLKKIKACIMLLFTVWVFGFIQVSIAFMVSFDHGMMFTNYLYVFLASTIFSYIVYFRSIDKKTKEGQKIFAAIKGFKMYLETAEENRLNLLHVPEKTLELYEEMFPYAMALNVENKWGKKFLNVFEKISYQPKWIKSNHRFNKNFSKSISKTLSSQIKTSSFRSSGGGGNWSSGSRGRGSSGRGGGGGGGRGW